MYYIWETCSHKMSMRINKSSTLSSEDACLKGKNNWQQLRGSASMTSWGRKVWKLKSLFLKFVSFHKLTNLLSLMIIMMIMMNCFSGMVDWRKALHYFWLGPLSENQTIVNLWHTLKKDSNQCNIKFCSSDNLYTSALSSFTCVSSMF